MNAVNTFTLCYECAGHDNICACFPSTCYFFISTFYLLKASAIMFTVCVCMCRWMGGGGESPAVFP